jgi:glycosyltransferase involved in cell wall biosynthesis
MPSHHQSAFFDALVDAGVDLAVRYYGRVTQARINLGWAVPGALPGYASYVTADGDALENLTDWQTRVHILPGYGSRFVWTLRQRLCDADARWVHWSELASPGFRWILTYPIKRWYSRQVNVHALGAFGIGELAIRDFTRWGINRESIALLPYAIAGLVGDVAPDGQCQAFLRGRKAYLFVGKLSHGKGVDVLLEAFASIAAEHREWCLILCGDEGGRDSHQKQAARLGISDRVLFRGVVASSDVNRIFRAADVFLLPSRNKDGWGIAMNEAASLGMPLIASTRVGSAYHLIEPGVNGFRVTPGDAVSLRRAMLAYARSPKLISEHGLQSRRLFEQFTPAENARRFVAAVESWLAMRAGPALATGSSNGNSR